MTTLHILRSAPTSNSAFSDLLNTAQPNDTVILIDDGCYALHSPIMVEKVELKLINKINVVASHQSARAINDHLNIEQLAQEFAAIDMAAVVNLTLAHERVITWQ